ncbi:MAG TPA: TetR family transcriptional regulator [Ktedonosporobacter sp.]|nr:TetR family transcriptional regulator [Ktedonosporobacter sp.]
MVHRGQGASTHEQTGERREARAQRILDAASTLILRYGYHKTTIDDIAREAGVGKGTLYLHWKTREALFAALILREKVAMAGDIKQSIVGDPAGATLRGLLKHSALALLHRPLLKAVLLRDTEVFGKLVQREQSSALSEETFAGFTAYLEGLREQHLVRTDLSLHALVALFGSIFTGFFLAAPLLPDAFRPSDEELAELMAETGHRTLEPRDPASSGALQIASHSLTQFLDRSVVRAQEQFHVDGQAEFEGDLLNAQMSARARGRKGGRSKKLKTAAAVAEARRMYADKSRSIAEICSALGISRASFYRYIKDASQEGT